MACCVHACSYSYTHAASEAPGMQPPATADSNRQQQTATPPKHATRIDQTHEGKHINHRHLAALNCRTHAHVQNLLSLTQKHAQYNRIHTHTHTHTHNHTHRHRHTHTHTAALRLEPAAPPLFASVPRGLSSSLSSSFAFFWRQVGRVCANVCTRVCMRPRERARRESQRCGRQRLVHAFGHVPACAKARRRAWGGCCGGACARAERESKSTGIQWTPAPRLRRHDRCGSPAAPRPHRASHHTQQFARPGLSASPRT